MNVLRAHRLRLAVSIAVLAVAVAGVSSAFASSSRAHRVANTAAVRPTIVLVHGAWANPGSWAAGQGLELSHMHPDEKNQALRQRSAHAAAGPVASAG